MRTYGGVGYFLQPALVQRVFETMQRQADIGAELDRAVPHVV